MTEPDSFQDGGSKTWRGWLRHGRVFIQKPLYLITFLAILTAFLAGAWIGFRQASQSEPAGGRRVLYYVDPMNPAHTSPEPGLAPCGMKMEPVFADGDAAESPPPSLPPGAVKITPQKQQLVGVRLAVVEKAPYTYLQRALGRVAIDETRIYRLNAFVDGWILKTFSNSTSSLVMKGESLATFYSREFITAEQAYLYALSTLDRLKQGEQLPPGNQLIVISAQIRGAEENLENLGMSKAQIKELGQTRRLTQDIELRAPVTSFVLARNVSPGQKISKSDELYRLADLSRVWIVADLYEKEARFVKPGSKVRATMPYQDQTFTATVTEIIPEFDKVSRTLKVRLEAENPGYNLRPDMFVDVEFPFTLPETVTVAVDAVIDSGLKHTVFVDRGNGYFEPRPVETGWRLGDRVQITKGLKPGENIVISGNFLVDSESRMKLAAAGMFGEVTQDPVCGLQVDENKTKVRGHQSQFNHQTYSFCSEKCKETFDRTPERYAGKKVREAAEAQAMAVKPTTPAMAKDPVCGLEVDEAQAKMRGLTSEYHGKTYYFCRYHCNRQFDQDPANYAAQQVAVCSHDPKEQEEAAIVHDPVCNLEVDPVQAAGQRLKREYQGKTYYFCRDYCSQQFDQDPERYAAKPAPPAAAPEGQTLSALVPVQEPGMPPHQPGHGQEHYLVKALGLDGHLKLPGTLQETPVTDKDPVCGMKLGEEVVQGLAYKSSYKGKLYYFCSEGCKQSFDRDPERYFSKTASSPAPPNQAAAPLPPATTKDPVCGTDLGLSVGILPHKSILQGKTYYFCSEDCKKKFDKTPADYAQKTIDTVTVQQQQIQPIYPGRGGRFRQNRTVTPQQATPAPAGGPPN